MKTTKRLIAFFMAAMMIFSALPVMNVSAKTVESGKCGENLKWALDDKGKLTISGTGEMYNYSFYSAAPWADLYEKVKAVNISSGVTSIGTMAFYDNADLTSVKIADSVTCIGNNAFSGCSELKSVIIPDSVTDLGSLAFGYCEKLSKITMSDNIKNIGQNAFSGTAYFNKTSNWKSGVLYIGKALIEADADKLSGAYTVKDGTKCIADCAFSDVHYLTSIKLPDSVTHIGSYAFSDCGNLKSITFPDKLESIGDNAFYFCRFEKLTVPGSVKTIGKQAFFMCKIENLTIGNGVKKIESHAFDWSNLKSVKIPDSVTSIENEAFLNCGLESVFIPKSVKSIGAMAFGYKVGWADDGYPGDNVKIEGFKIEGIKGSAAETYAKENGFKFVTHKHSYTSKVTTKATTSKNGKITYTCDCGYSYSKSISKIKSIALSSDTYTYNGKAKKPTVTVTDSKGNTLKNGTDYTVKYSSGRKNVGKYTVTVTFKGKYSGTKKLTFKIKPKSTSISKLTAGKKQFTATWYKRSEQTSGYQLQYSTSSKMTNAKSKTLSGTSKNSLTVSNLKSAKKYYVQIRTYKNVKINGKTYKYYSAWSSVKSVKTK